MEPKAKRVPKGWKKCSVCGTVKRLGEFHNNTRSPDGKTTVCKECARKKAREWQAREREGANVQKKNLEQRIEELEERVKELEGKVNA